MWGTNPLGIHPLNVVSFVLAVSHSGFWCIRGWVPSCSYWLLAPALVCLFGMLLFCYGYWRLDSSCLLGCLLIHVVCCWFFASAIDCYWSGCCCWYMCCAFCSWLEYMIAGCLAIFCCSWLKASCLGRLLLG